MRQTPKSTDLALQLMLDPRRVLRWTHVGRMVVVTAVFAAATLRWQQAGRTDTLVATLAFVLGLAWTAGMVLASSTGAAGTAPRNAAPRPLPPTLLAAQALVDLLLATAVVHVTGGGSSQFAALYILVMAAAALLLPAGRGLLVAALGSALYALDVTVLRPFGGFGAELGLWLQLTVFGTVALGSCWIGARLRQAGVGGERLAAALARARFEAADILVAIRSGVLTVDAEGRLLFANPAAAALLGLDLAAMTGRPVLAEVARRAPELAAVLHRAAAHGERTTRAEGRIVRDGAEALIGVTTTVAGLGDDAADDAGDIASENAPDAGAEGDARARDRSTGTPGHARGGIGTAIFSDITASKRLEALHLRAERLEAVAELSASLAHEIKNPLASIRSATESLGRLAEATIRGGLTGEDADDVRSLAALTTRESDRLSRLLSEFLDFARARVTRVERVDARTLAGDAARLAGAHPDAAGVTVEVAVDGAPAIDGDPELLHRALFNLVLNAVQASPAGGRVRVRVERANGDALPGGLAFAHGAVAVHVRDAGPGIAPALLDRLFDPFFTTRPGGSGLGLAVVQRAVEAHRGVVLVEPGGAGTEAGAHFTLLLPAAPADRAAPALAPLRPYLPTPPVAHRAVA